MNKVAFAIVVCSMALAPAAALGYTFNDADIAAWAGTTNGANQAVTVVDFGGGNSYAFGYKWDGDATSEDMLLALNTQTDLTVGYAYHPTLGFSPMSFSYDGHSMVSDGGTTTYLAFWWSGYTAWSEDVWAQDGSGNWYLSDTIDHPATPGDGENWYYAGLGAGARELADGVWDGWTLGDATTWAAATPVTPAPEPTTMCVIAAGGLMLLRRRRARS